MKKQGKKNKKGNSNNRLAFFILLVAASLQMSCNKLVEVADPPTLPDADIVYKNDATATAVLTGIYTQLAGFDGGVATGSSSISLLTGLSADELTAYSSSGSQKIQIYHNALTSNAPYPGVPFWSSLYAFIYATNTAIEGINSSSSLSLAVKNQLLGEAKFMRAFFYFYLVNLWGDVPLITTTNYQSSSLAGRSPKADVWLQIIKDLKDAQGLLNTDYLALDLKTITTERVRPNKWAATALLARAYLYTGDYVNAEKQSSMIINTSSMYNLIDLNSVFLSNSNEAIWQLQSISLGWNTQDARTFILTSAPNFTKPVSVSNNLISAFESNDQRLVNWIGNIIVNAKTYYFPYKYKSATQDDPVVEYLMVFRLAEQYLIRAEAEANSAGGGINAAIVDLNIIRNRAQLPDYMGAADKSSILTAILHERQVELFTEWGHRWLDLKRTGSIDAVMSVVTPQKGGVWNSNWQLYPIPLVDIQRDPALTGKQNPGY